MDSLNFSSSASDVIQRKLDVAKDVPVSPKERLDDLAVNYELERCVKWILDHTFARVALQFPDELLKDSCFVLKYLEEKTRATVFILGDTSYGSCCVDDVAAQHYTADSIIHFGQSCLSGTSRLPVMFVFGKRDVDVDDCCTKLRNVCEETEAVILFLYDVRCTHVAETIYNQLKETFTNIILTHTDSTNINIDDHNEMKISKLCNRSIIATDTLNVDTCIVFYIGSEGLTLTNMMMSLNKCHFYTYNPISRVCRKESVNINKNLMRRYYKVEQAKDAKVVGIVIGTLGVVQYLDVIDRLKVITKKAGKKSYMFSVGKLNVAKLANFMEIDVFVLVACPENSLLDSAEYYKPIVTPFEMELACNPDRQWTGDYVTDFSHLLPGGEAYVAMGEVNEDTTDVSLLSGRLRTMGVVSEQPGVGGEIMTREEALTVAINHHDAANFLSTRSYQGLEVKLGQTEVVKASVGQIGVAMGYRDVATHNTGDSNIVNTDEHKIV